MITGADAQITGAIIGGLATVATAVFAYFKRSPETKSVKAVGGSTAVDASQASKSNVAVGNNISLTQEHHVHNYVQPVHPVPAFGDKTPSRPSVDEIFQHLKTAKPYDRVSMAENYKGLEVSWPLHFFLIAHSRTTKDGRLCRYCVFTASRENSMRLVGFDVDPDKYPKIKVIDAGHLCWVRGNILAVDYSTVVLRGEPDVEFE